MAVKWAWRKAFGREAARVIHRYRGRAAECRKAPGTRRCDGGSEKKGRGLSGETARPSSGLGGRGGRGAMFPREPGAQWRSHRPAVGLAGAADRFYRSARSLWAQGLRPEALRTLEEGVAVAERLDDESVAKKLGELFVTFQAEQRLENK